MTHLASDQVSNRIARCSNIGRALSIVVHKDVDRSARSSVTHGRRSEGKNERLDLVRKLAFFILVLYEREIHREELVDE